MGSGDDVVRGSSLDWYRSSFCQAGECVEIAETDGRVIMRSSVYPDGGYIYLSRKEFGFFLAAAKAGEYASF
jgi:Domain of unknown function (DUF397)